MRVRYFGWPILKCVVILAEVNRTAVVGYPMGSALTSSTTRVCPLKQDRLPIFKTTVKLVCYLRNLMPWFRKRFVFIWLTGNMKSHHALMCDI